MKKSLFTILSATVLLASCDNLKNPATKNEPEEATADTAVVYRKGEAGPAVAVAEGDLIDTDALNLPAADFPEVNLPDVSVRGNDQYSVYGIEETVLFDTDKATIKPSAAKALEQISASIGQRSAGKQMRIIGHADSRDTKSYNKELSEQRAEAVKNWLVQNGKIEASRVAIQPMGESKPVASNETAAGRQQNRRVEIAVINK